MIHINILFTVSAPALEDASAFDSFGQWVKLNEREGRLLFDAVCPQESVIPVLHVLTAMGKSPCIVGAWHRDGTPVDTYPLRESEWLAVAPDDLDQSSPESSTPIRPTEFVEIHGWAGWAPKQIQKATGDK